MNTALKTTIKKAAAFLALGLVLGAAAGCRAIAGESNIDFNAQVKLLSISSLDYPDENPVDAVRGENQELFLTIPFHWNITRLLGTFTLESGARVEPDPRGISDYSEPVIFTLFLENGQSTVFSVEVRRFPPTAREIISFSFSGIAHENAIIAESDDNDIEGTITVFVPFGTDITNLAASADYAGASISPAPGEARNYADGTADVFTVHAEDPALFRDYTVLVVERANTESRLLTFKLGSAVGDIDYVNNTVAVTVPYGTNLTITPEVTVSAGASYTPAGAQNFGSARLYTVRAADGVTTTDYTVTATAAANTAKRITSFKIPTVAGLADAVGSINETTKKITVTLPSGMAKTALAPVIVFEGKLIYPASGTTQNFTNPVSYTVTADNDTTEVYEVTVTVNGTGAASTLQSVSANGSEHSATTTLLTLEFSADMPTLKAENISFSGGYTRGNLSSIGNKKYTIGITGSWTQGAAVNVTVANPIGYTVSGSPKTGVILNKAPTSITYSGLAADGTNASATTTKLAISLGADIAGLALTDLTLTPSPLTAVSLTKVAGQVGKYDLAISGIPANNTGARVTLSKPGFTFTPVAYKDVSVWKKQVLWTALEQVGGSSNGSTSTWALRITFDTDLGASIDADDFTLSGTIVKAGPLVNEGGGSYLLPVAGIITHNGSHTVSLTKTTFGQEVLSASSPTSKNITVYFRNPSGTIASGQDANTNLMIKFGIKTTGYSNNTLTGQDVTDTFIAVQRYITATDPGSGSSKVRVGDYLDMPRLIVKGYADDPASSIYGRGEINLPDTALPGPVRVKVAGINTYKDLNSNPARHLIFQFAAGINERRMNSTNTNDGGYGASEMRKYLVDIGGSGGNFLTGLKNAGVPASALYALNRRLLAGNTDAANLESIQDLVWLPTLREAKGSELSISNGSISTKETEAVQPKLSAATIVDRMFFGTPSVSHTTSFMFQNGGESRAVVAGDGKWIAPAFVIK